MWYVGPDVHLKSSSICVLDEHGRRINQKKILGPWPKLVAWLKDLPEPVSVCYEASCGYGPLYDALSQIVARVEVAHPGHLRLIFRSKKKNDRVDAQKLARLLYLDEVPTVHAPSARPGRSAPMSLEFDESGFRCARTSTRRFALLLNQCCAAVALCLVGLPHCMIESGDHSAAHAAIA